jgi:hypothetical protein
MGHPGFVVARTKPNFSRKGCATRPGFDVVQLFRSCIRDPQLLQPTWDRMVAEAQARAAAQAQAKKTK